MAAALITVVAVILCIVALLRFLAGDIRGALIALAILAIGAFLFNRSVL